MAGATFQPVPATGGPGTGIRDRILREQFKGVARLVDEARVQTLRDRLLRRMWAVCDALEAEMTCTEPGLLRSSERRNLRSLRIEIEGRMCIFDLSEQDDPDVRAQWPFERGEALLDTLADDTADFVLRVAAAALDEGWHPVRRRELLDAAEAVVLLVDPEADPMGEGRAGGGTELARRVQDLKAA